MIYELCFKCVALFKTQYRIVLESKKKVPILLLLPSRIQLAFNFCVIWSWKFCTCILLSHSEPQKNSKKKPENTP